MKKIKIILLFLLVVSDSAQEMYYNVVDYGAKGDGQTNNTETINSAIIDAAKNGGGTVYFPAGGGKEIKVSWEGPGFEKRELKLNVNL